MGMTSGHLSRQDVLMAGSSYISLISLQKGPDEFVSYLETTSTEATHPQPPSILMEVCGPTPQSQSLTID